MKLYWSDRQGAHPPSDATFFVAPFSGKTEKYFDVERVEELPQPTSTEVVNRSFSPTYDEWERIVEKAKFTISEKKLQKVVLARVCHLELASAPDPFQIAAGLKRKAEGAYLFCLQTAQGAFLGATPERLFKREGRQIITEAMAGTRRRGEDPFEDARLKAELIASVKDSKEFQPVQDYLVHSLSPYCSTPLEFTPLSVHQTQNVQHLYRSGSALLKDTYDDEILLSELHPTPALCGLPKVAARNFIETQEPFSRGLYGGVLGWQTEETSEWIVMIRSCYLQGNRATIYSGLGIVEDSNAKEEWEELNQKMNLYSDIFR
jgi:menaquinone-specific isochorismate synthase